MRLPKSCPWCTGYSTAWRRSGFRSRDIMPASTPYSKHGSRACRVVMDGDGQHPVTLIPRMLHLHANGVDIVRTVRIDGVEAGAAWKRWLSARFHDLWAALSQTAVPHNTTEFALFGRHVLEALQRH